MAFLELEFVQELSSSVIHSYLSDLLGLRRSGHPVRLFGTLFESLRLSLRGIEYVKIPLQIVLQLQRTGTSLLRLFFFVSAMIKDIELSAFPLAFLLHHFLLHEFELWVFVVRFSRCF